MTKQETATEYTNAMDDVEFIEKMACTVLEEYSGDETAEEIADAVLRKLEECVSVLEKLYSKENFEEQDIKTMGECIGIINTLKIYAQAAHKDIY